MATMQNHATSNPAHEHDKSKVKNGVEQRIEGPMAFWTKVNNDWVFNLSGALAYSFLVSIFPIMLVLLAIAGFVIGAASPASYQQLQNSISSALPSGIGKTVVAGALDNLRRSAGLIFVIGLLGAVFTGSRLFVAMENFSGVIFRLRSRAPLQQNIMAICMMLLYTVLVPILFLASIVPTALINALGGHSGNVFTGFLLQLAGIVAGFIVACVLFGAIYIVVPNRPVKLKEVWKGTLVAAGLLVVYEIVFPLYESYALKPGNYGALAGFALVMLAFFYYLAFILLFGMEINSWTAGQRQTESDLPGIIHEVQAHATIVGAAGPTAGSKQEDLQNGKGKEAMSDISNAIRHEQNDHHGDLQPPEFKKKPGFADKAANSPQR